MKQIDLTRKFSYTRALSLPFRIAPFYTLLSLLDRGVKLASAPLEVLATAGFIDASIAAVQETAPEYWKSAFMWLACIVLLKVYEYIEEPLSALMDAKKKEKEWYAVNYPAISLRAGLKLQHIENSADNDLISRTDQPADSLCGMLWNAVNLLVFAGQILSYVIILMRSAPLSGCVILVAAIPMISIAKKSALAQYKAKKDTTMLQRKTWTLQGYLKNRECVSERNLFSYYDFIEKKFREGYEEFTKVVLQAEFSWEARRGISGVVLTALCAVVVFLLMPSVTAGALSVGLYISLVRNIFSAADRIAFDLAPYLEKITADMAFLKEFNQYVELERIPEALDPMAEKAPVFESLEFRHVSFTYPGTEKTILKDVSFKMEAGRHYSLIGINGSGKSTMVKLILKLYDNYCGEILLNGVSLRKWKMSEIKAMIGTVFQDFVRYDISIADNISAGCGMQAGDEEIDNAVSVAGLAELVAGLPEGKQTLLGKVHENAQDLSGGQWQKIALARSVVSHSSLKILDEPTAALDPMAEREVYREFDKISKGAATIFISHRLASCVHADRIFLLDEGVITEAGSHQELMELHGKYAEMFESQRGWYL